MELTAFPVEGNMELKIELCQFLVQICSMNLCKSREKVKSWGSLRKISKQDELKSFFVSGLWRHFFAFYPSHVCQAAVLCCDCGGWLFKAVMELWWATGAWSLLLHMVAHNVRVWCHHLNCECSCKLVVHINTKDVTGTWAVYQWLFLWRKSFLPSVTL